MPSRPKVAAAARRVGQRMAPGAAGLGARQVLLEAHVAGAGNVALAGTGPRPWPARSDRSGRRARPTTGRRGGRRGWPDQRVSCAWASGPRSVTASWWRKRPTSVTTPMVCVDPRSLSLVTTAGLMSTRHHLDPRRHHVADADAVQHRAQHDDQRRRRPAPRRSGPAPSSGPSPSRAAGRRRGSSRPARRGRRATCSACITPCDSSPDADRRRDAAGAPDGVDGAHVLRWPCSTGRPVSRSMPSDVPDRAASMSWTARALPARTTSTNPRRSEVAKYVRRHRYGRPPARPRRRSSRRAPGSRAASRRRGSPPPRPGAPTTRRCS